MGNGRFAEKFALEKMQAMAEQAKLVARGTSIGGWIKTIRMQLGMSQAVLSKRSGVPQATISHIERGDTSIGLKVISQVLDAMSSQLIVLPLMTSSIDSMRREQAEKKADEHIEYLKGTMALEEQTPDDEFLNALREQEIQRLLFGPKSKLWKD